MSINDIYLKEVRKCSINKWGKTGKLKELWFCFGCVLVVLMLCYCCYWIKLLLTMGVVYVMVMENGNNFNQRG